MAFTLHFGWGGTLWKKALRNGGALVCGIVISNITDATVPLYSKDWFRHVFISSVTVFLVTELTYTKNWLSSGNGGSNGSTTSDSIPASSSKRPGTNTSS